MSPTYTSAKKNWLLSGAVLLVLVLGGLITGIYFLNRSQNLGGKAAPTTTLSLTTSQSTANVGETISVAVTAQTGTNVVRALDVELKYDPHTLQLLDLTKSDWLNAAAEANKTIDQTTGIGSLSLIIPPTANPNFVSGNGTALIATFKVLSASPQTRVTFNTAKTTVGAANERQNVVISYADLNLTTTETNTIPQESGDFFAYTYDSCIGTNSDGHSTYIVWNKNKFPNVAFIDVSERADFGNSANKAPTNVQELQNGFVITDATNFRHVDGGKELFTFSPDKTYYFRLFFSNQHSATTTYRGNACGGAGGISYKACNESCNSQTECGPDLVCDNNRCRRSANLGDDQCRLPPDKGLQRSCNAYCANDGECSSGLKCWWNQCREPKNLNDAACKLPAPKPTTKPVDSTQTKGGVSTGTTSPKPSVTAKPTIAPTGKVSSGSTKATTSATVKIDVTKVPTKAAAVRDFPEAKPTVVPETATSSPLSWVPAVLAIVFIAVLVIMFGPKVLAAFSQQGKAPLVPPTRPTAATPTGAQHQPTALRPVQPNQTTATGTPAKPSFGKPLNSGVPLMSDTTTVKPTTPQKPPNSSVPKT
jgi:hypothetical protein